MPNLGGDVVVIRVTSSSSTASFRDISAQVQDFSGLDFEAILQESHTFGDAWQENLYANFRKINEITFGGFYDDDTTTGVRGLFFQTTDVGAERVMKINFGSTNAYPKFDYLIRKSRLLPKRGELSMYEITIQPTGALTIAAT